jgi:hypothetical protein
VIDFSKAAGGPSARKQSEEEMTRTMQSMMSWTATIETIGEMEDDPREIARLHAITIAERLKLDAATTASIEKEIAREFAELAAAGLVRSKRPSGRRPDGLARAPAEVLHAAAARSRVRSRGPAPAVGRRAVSATWQRVCSRRHNGR